MEMEEQKTNEQKAFANIKTIFQLRNKRFTNILINKNMTKTHKETFYQGNYTATIHEHPKHVEMHNIDNGIQYMPLSEKDKLKIRMLYSSGISALNIARVYKVNINEILNIIK